MKKIKSILFSKKVLIIFGVILLVIFASIPSIYFYQKYQQSQKLLQNPTEAAREETKMLIADVGKVIELPKGEEPTVATVTDKDKLKGQPFFTNTQVGDKVLIFTQAKKAILYRPDTHKIIEVAPLNIGTAESTVSASPAVSTSSAVQTKTVKIALYNGTATVGLTNTYEMKLKNNADLASKIEVVAKENASRNDYSKTLVIDLVGNQNAMAQSIAEVLGGQVSPLPQRETKPNSEMLVIIGK